MASSDSLFFTLPKRTRRAIDDAFDLSINPNQFKLSGSRRRNVSVEPISGGGGFLTEDTSSRDFQESPEPTHLPLDLIPSALQHLDLPPDDNEILSVFRNAASGWTSSSVEPLLTTDSHGKYVVRDDWRAVCAVLLENRSKEDGPDEENSDDAGDENMEEYDSDQERPSIASDDDEYMDHRFTSSSRRMRGGKNQTRRPLSQTRSNNALTKRQKQTCLDTFRLFFPDVPVSEVEKQNIMIKDLQRVAKLLNEKLKVDEMLEMLETFSSSPQKSMNFDDFSHMMIAANLA